MHATRVALKGKTTPLPFSRGGSDSQIQTAGSESSQPLTSDEGDWTHQDMDGSVYGLLQRSSGNVDQQGNTMNRTIDLRVGVLSLALAATRLLSASRLATLALGLGLSGIVAAPTCAWAVEPAHIWGAPASA